MVRGRSKPLLTVAQIFNKVQEGVSGHSKYAKLLWDVHEANPSVCWRDFAFCLDHLLTLPQAGRPPLRALLSSRRVNAVVVVCILWRIVQLRTKKYS